MRDEHEPRPATAPGSGFLVDGAHLLPVRVYWEDTDAGGIVYHASYVRFMERGRTEMLRCLGMEQSRLRAEQGLLYVVRRVEIDFLAPGAIDMALTVRTGLRKLGGASLALWQRVEHGGEALAAAQVLCVGVGPDGKPRRAPDAVRDAFASMRESDAP